MYLLCPTVPAESRIYRPAKASARTARSLATPKHQHSGNHVTSRQQHAANRSARCLERIKRNIDPQQHTPIKSPHMKRNRLARRTHDPTIKSNVMCLTCSLRLPRTLCALADSGKDLLSIDTETLWTRSLVDPAAMASFTPVSKSDCAHRHRQAMENTAFPWSVVYELPSPRALYAKQA